ncbi:MAG: acylphosphatase [Geminicoccaceae bacterium]|jgi:acylphosphatase|nr:acylphosphatase [Geminicoccaceae bacterium]MCB9966460.1 acylphosphatase [Geminicoccaceae bacterium]HRY23046.1 acylphosphatase [Geminicoccaceae bacterium]
MAARLRIYGRVQGVGYRAWLIRIAEARGIDGWARNRADGSVEALLHGDPEMVQAVVERCHRGPRLARVDRIEQAPDGSVPDRGFVQRPTA